MSRSFSLSWTRFARVAVLLIGLPGLFLFADYRAGELDAMALSLPLLCVSFLAFSAYRWSRMRRDLAAGTFTEADFRKSPLKILVGYPLHAILWLLFTMLLVFLPVVWWAYGHWPRA
jgi:cbb3-type cytochrome oxidase subunit 3